MKEKAEIVELDSAQQFEPMTRLTKDLLDASLRLTPQEARFLVDFYYQIQHFRTISGNQIKQSNDAAEPNTLLKYNFAQFKQFEEQIKRSLGKYAESTPVGRWMLSITGIGPIIASGMLSFIDIKRAPTAGSIWRYAGWEGAGGEAMWLGDIQHRKSVQTLIDAWFVNHKKLDHEGLSHLAYEFKRRPANLINLLTQNDQKLPITKIQTEKLFSRRPYNRGFRTLCWKLGDCFMKFHNLESCTYGHIYAERKALEIQRNESGAFKQVAQDTLALKNFNKGTDTYKAYSDGKLPDGRIHQRACRYAVKIFLSHLHHVMYVDEFGNEPPNPFVIEHQGHTHKIKIPNYEQPLAAH